MTFKDDLLRKGYFPEQLPPAVHSEKIADAFLSRNSNTYIVSREINTRPARYNASKRGQSRRIFSIPNPIVAHDASKFCNDKEGVALEFMRTGLNEISVPKRFSNSRRAINIASYEQMERARF